MFHNQFVCVGSQRKYTSDEWWDNCHTHFIVGSVSVNNGVTLTIEEGSTIRFEGNYSITIYGTLIADGTESQQITFTSSVNSPGSWKYLSFSSADPGCILDWCDIYYGGSVNGMIYSISSGSNVQITNCDIQFSGTKGLYLNDSTSISNCVISNNTEDGVRCANSYISNCSFQNNGNYAIKIACSGVKNITGNITISGNTHNSIYVTSGSTNSGTWNYHGVPYIIGGDISINDGKTLTIPAGNTLKFDGNYNLYIYGKLKANGTPENHITFTSNNENPSAGNWKRIYFSNSDSGCSLAYCDILYGGSQDGAIYSYGSGGHVTMSYCSIRYSGTTGLYLYDSPTITNCVIEDNNGHGIYCIGSYADSPISNCEINNNSGHGIYGSSNTADPLISDCTIQNNGSYAIRTGADNVKNIIGNMIITGNTNNSIFVTPEFINSGTWNYYGVPYIIGGDISINNGKTLTLTAGNTLKFDGNYHLYIYGKLKANGTSGNRVIFTSNQAIPSSGDWEYIYFYEANTGSSLNYCDFFYGGSIDGIIRFYKSYDYVSLNNCNIEYSQNAGAFIKNNSSPSFINCVIRNNDQYGININSHGGHPIFGSNLTEWNDIYDNNGDGVGRSFLNSINNNTAEYIYWGTIDETEINALIYDDADDSSLGIVDYTPWTNAAHDTAYPQTGIDPPQNVTIAIVGTQVQITWNAVAGATSYKVYSSDNPYIGFTEDVSGNLTGTSWTAQLTGNMKFYYITAVNSERETGNRK